MWMMLNPPVAHLEFLTQFGLSHHLVPIRLLRDNKKYKRFYKKLSRKGHWLTLDNSVIETGDSVLDPSLVKGLKVAELVAPTFLFDKERTLDETTRFLKDVRRNPSLSGAKIMGVPQGKNASDYFQCLISMVENPYIDTVGIGKMATSAVVRVLDDYPSYLKSLFGRFAVLTFICEEFSRSKPIHILGLVNPEVEIPFYLHLPFVRSFNSSFPFRYFLSGKYDGSMDYETELESSVLRKCMAWIERFLSVEGVEI